MLETFCNLLNLTTFINPILILKERGEKRRRGEERIE
jgi:hypothetical protein